MACDAALLAAAERAAAFARPSASSAGTRPPCRSGTTSPTSTADEVRAAPGARGRLGAPPDRRARGLPRRPGPGADLQRRRSAGRGGAGRGLADRAAAIHARHRRRPSAARNRGHARCEALRASAPGRRRRAASGRPAGGRASRRRFRAEIEAGGAQARRQRAAALAVGAPPARLDPARGRSVAARRDLAGQPRAATARPRVSAAAGRRIGFDELAARPRGPHSSDWLGVELEPDALTDPELARDRCPLRLARARLTPSRGGGDTHGRCRDVPSRPRPHIPASLREVLSMNARIGIPIGFLTLLAMIGCGGGEPAGEGPGHRRGPGRRRHRGDLHGQRLRRLQRARLDRLRHEPDA